MHEIDDNEAFIATFRSSLGWFALAVSCEQVVALTFGRRSRSAALAAIGARTNLQDSTDSITSHLIERLQRFADGEPDDFLDVELSEVGLTPFGRRVVHHCRRIGFGDTLTYGQLAAKAGSPRAARAVGNVMAHNRFPIIVPCHRVLGAGGLGGYSAPDGLKMKKRLLQLEGRLTTA